jgi:hypothetical protein
VDSPLDPFRDHALQEIDALTELAHLLAEMPQLFDVARSALTSSAGFTAYPPGFVQPTA